MQPLSLFLVTKVYLDINSAIIMRSSLNQLLGHALSETDVCSYGVVSLAYPPAPIFCVTLGN
jgi:hypothetical protein